MRVVKNHSWLAMVGLTGALSTAACGSTPPPACDATMDDTAQTAVTIKFGGSVGLAYDTPCIKVKAGTPVTFAGDFSAHPLAGGASPPTVDTTSPIKETRTGTSATFTLATAGTYKYFCEFHYSSNGMAGTIVVE
jgi:plastocyanin